MANLQGQEALSRIYRIAEAGEKGFATAAVNMPDPGLKVLLKYFAQQRANYKGEILAELQRLDQNGKPWSSLPGMIHRGRMAIFAALVEKEEREKVILDEVARGENVAWRVYQSVLDGPLPAQTRAMLARQMEEIRQVREQIDLLRGKTGKQMVLKLYPGENEAGAAIQTLQETGLAVEIIQRVDLKKAGLYSGGGATLLETLLSGAFGGALWGGLVGILVGFGVTQTIYPPPASLAAMLWMWIPAALGCLLAGAFLATGLVLFIGLGISEEDNFRFNEILKQNPVLLGTLVNSA
jgi:uncharacterized protein (TIGR02284 family)